MDEENKPVTEALPTELTGNAVEQSEPVKVEEEKIDQPEDVQS